MGTRNAFLIVSCALIYQTADQLRVVSGWQVSICVVVIKIFQNSWAGQSQIFVEKVPATSLVTPSFNAPFAFRAALCSPWYRSNKLVIRFCSILTIAADLQLHVYDVHLPFFRISKVWRVILWKATIRKWANCDHKGMNMVSNSTWVDCGN